MFEKVYDINLMYECDSKQEKRQKIIHVMMYVELRWIEYFFYYVISEKQLKCFPIQDGIFKLSQNL